MRSDRTQAAASRRPKYVIISDYDAPQPSMVCQWVPRFGYCYMDRRENKPRFDGMRGMQATPIETFGFDWEEDSDGMVRFYPADRPVTATYPDGQPRRWQSQATSFEWRALTVGAVQKAEIDGNNG
jgi:hypothetical protein